MKVISLNANGIRAAQRKGFFDWMKKVDPEVVCIQETKAQVDQLTLPDFHPAGYHCYYEDAEKKGYSGVAIYARREPDKVIRGLGSEGEVDDLLSAIAWVRDRFPGLPLWLAGFSFGGAIAIHAAIKVSPAGLVTVAPATYRFAGDASTYPTAPWLIVQGDKDELVDIDETVEYVNSLEPGPQLAVFPDAEHFFHGRLVELRHTVEAFIGENQ